MGRALAVGAVLACVSACLLVCAPAHAANSCDDKRWVAIWGSSPVEASPDVSLAGRTVRTPLTPLGRGNRVRLTLSNRFGDHPLTLDAVYAGIEKGGAAVVRGTNHRVRFDGRSAVRVAPGEDAVSDAFALRVRPLEQISVTFHIESGGGTVTTMHPTALQTTYVAAAERGDVAASESARPFSAPDADAIGGRPLLTSLDARRSSRAHSVVALGDSLTDGYQAPGAGIDSDQRYPDFLAGRLAAAGRAVSVVNAGISGNSLLGEFIPAFGPSALSRLGTDVIDKAGAEDVIAVIGRNDFGFYEPDDVIAGLRELIARLHRRGIDVLVGTHSPGSPAVLAPAEAAEQEHDRIVVNRWIRRQRSADAVIDFDRALRQANDHHVLRRRFSSGDGAHLSAAGYRAMARAIDLDLLASGRC